MKPDIVEVEPGVYSIILNGRVFEARLDSGAVTILGQKYNVEINDPRKYVRRGNGGTRSGRDTIKAPMPGKIVRVLVNVGDTVVAGQGIAVIEAMKMQNELKAPSGGLVTLVSAKEGETVAAGAVLAAIE